MEKRNVHFTLQGKGGVGKSYVATLLMQALKENGHDPIGIDTDPVNQTFAGYEALNVGKLKILENNNIIPRAFDELIEKLLKNDNDFIVDNGASSFLPLSQYLTENDAFQILKDGNKDVWIHTVVTGGQALRDTLSGLAAICEQLSADVHLVVWLNEYFGKVEVDNKQFEDMKVFQNNIEKISGIVIIPKQNESTFGEDVKQMVSSRKTFAEMADSDASIMVKSRLSRVKKTIFDQLKEIPGLL